MSIRWRDLDQQSQPGAWRGLMLSVAEGARPRFAVSACHPSCIRISVDETPVLWTRIEEGYYGYFLLRARRSSSFHVLPSIPFGMIDEVRSKSDTRGVARAWARTYLDMLERSDASPCYAGRWLLGASNEDECENELPVPWVQTIVEQSSHGYLAWDRNRLYPITLRDLSSPESGRVKAFRKHARAGTLPPILLYWVSGLLAHVVLDGHDRLLAAALEGVRAPVLYLEPVREEETAQKTKDAIAAVLGEGRLPTAQANDLALRTLVSKVVPEATRARPCPGGFPQWSAEVRRELILQRIDDEHLVEGLRHG